MQAHPVPRDSLERSRGTRPVCDQISGKIDAAGALTALALGPTAGSLALPAVGRRPGPPGRRLLCLSRRQEAHWRDLGLSTPCLCTACTPSSRVAFPSLAQGRHAGRFCSRGRSHRERESGGKSVDGLVIGNDRSRSALARSAPAWRCAGRSTRRVQWLASAAGRLLGGDEKAAGDALELASGGGHVLGRSRQLLTRRARLLRRRRHLLAGG